MILLNKRYIHQITIIFLVIFSNITCETQPEVVEELTPSVELLGSWDTNEIAPTNNPSDFKVVLKIANASIKLIGDETFCINNSGDNLDIISDITKARVFHTGIYTINFLLPDEFTDDYEGKLTNCKLTWKYLNEEAEEDKSVIELGSYNFDKIKPELIVNAPNTSLSPGQIADINNYFVQLTAKNKNLTIINSQNSCLNLQQLGNSKLAEGEPSSKIPIAAGNIMPDEDIGFGPGVKRCTIKAVDAAGNFVEEVYTLGVRIATFNASLDKNPPNYTYVRNQTASGRAKLTVNAESDGTVYCRTTTGITCLIDPWEISGNVNHEKYFESMYIGNDDYIITFTPKGYIPGTGWDTIVSFKNVEYLANLIFNVTLYDPPPTTFRSIGYSYHDPVALNLFSNFTGDVEIIPLNDTRECPPYKGILVTANVRAHISNVADGDYIGNYPVGGTPPDATVENIFMSCRAILTITKPKELFGSKAYSTFGYTLDRQPPFIEFVNGGFESIPIEDAINYAVNLIVSEPVLVEANSCNGLGVSTTLYEGNTALIYDHSDISTSSSGICSITFIDGVIDSMPSHRVTLEYTYDIERARLIYQKPFSFFGTVGNGTFEAHANGTILCLGPINASDGTPAEDCFHGSKPIAKSSSVAPTHEILMYLKAGTYDYQFTLIPFPPYPYSSPGDENNALHKTVITETITATENPLNFLFVEYNSNTRFGVNVPWTKQKIFSNQSGTITTSAAPGTSCPTFLPTPMEIDANVEKEFDLNITDNTIFPIGRNTTINCTLTLTTDETFSRTAELVIEDKIVDKLPPTLRFLSSENISVTVASNYNAEFYTNEAANLTSPTNCGSGRMANVGSNFVQLEIFNSSVPPVDTDTTRTYNCRFISVDDVGNQSAEISVDIVVFKPLFTIHDSPTAEGDIDFVTTLPNVTLQITASADGIVNCSLGGNSLGSISVFAGIRGTLTLTNLLPGTYDYNCRFNQNGITGFPTEKDVKIKYDSDITLTVNSSPPSITYDPNIMINVTPSRNGSLSTQTPSGGLCFTLNSPTFNLNRDIDYDLNVTLPSACSNGQICNINCNLRFEETETGLDNFVLENINFILNRESLQLAPTPFVPSSEIVNHDRSTYSITFRNNISLDNSVGPIKFRDYDNNGIIFTLSSSNLTVNGPTLTIDISSSNSNSLLNHHHFYISIPVGLIVSASSSGVFSGTCSSCGSNAKIWDYYTAVDISTISGYWTYVPNSGNSTQTPIPSSTISCSTSSSNQKYCLDLEPSFLTSAEISDYKNNYPMKFINNNQSFETNSNARSVDTSSQFKLELTGNDNFPNQATSVLYKLHYYYIQSSNEMFNERLTERLYTKKGVIVTNTNNLNIWSTNYNYSGVINLINDSNNPIVAAYGIRKLNSNYNGNAIKIGILPDSYDFTNSGYLSSSAAEATDVGFDSSGNLNTYQISNYMNNHPNKMIILFKWYDQSGNNKHLEQILRSSSGDNYSEFPIVGYPIGSNNQVVLDDNNKPSVLFVSPGFYNDPSNNFDSNTRSMLQNKYKRAILGSSALNINNISSYVGSQNIKSATLLTVMVPSQGRNNYTLGFSYYLNERWSLSVSNEGRYPIFEVGKQNATNYNYYKKFILDNTYTDQLKQFTLTVGSSYVLYHLGNQEVLCHSNCSASINWSAVNPIKSRYFQVGGSSDAAYSSNYFDYYHGGYDNTSKKVMISEIILYKNALSADERQLIVNNQLEYFNIQ